MATEKDKLLSTYEWKSTIILQDETLSYCFGENEDIITVLDRMTGFGYRDIETGYRDPEDYFWLASGNFDIREFKDVTFKEAIELIKEKANTCVPREGEALDVGILCSLLR